MSSGIKRSHFKYPRCQGGELHNGEIMNLVCVDASCIHRGLICPICRMESHETHKIMPLKSFLDQIEGMFVGSEGGEDLNNLTDYLRSLQNSRKQIQSLIKQQVISISNTFKELQVNLDELYYALRRSVLIQSSITTKLPSLVSIMTDENQKDPAEIQKEFKKYCELLKYQGEKIKVSDKARKIVEGFSQVPRRVKDVIEKGTEEYKNVLNKIPLLLDKQQLEKKAESSSMLVFSTEDKTSSIILSQNDTHATITSEQAGYGFVFLSGPIAEGAKTTIKVEQMTSFQLCLGVGNVQKFKDMAFLQIDPEDKANFEYIRCDGSTSQSSNLNESYGSDSSLPIPSSQTCFSFNQNGVILELQYDSIGNQLRLTKKGAGQQKFTMKLGEEVKQNVAKFKLLVGLGYMDRISLQKE